MRKIKYRLIVVDSEEDWFDDTQEYLKSSEKIVDMKFDDIKDLRKWWEILLSDYEGMNYCVYDCAMKDVIVSGTYDPNDIDSLFDEPEDAHFLYNYPIEIKGEYNPGVSAGNNEHSRTRFDKRTDSAFWKQVAADFMEVFDDFLEEHNITVPCADANEEQERSSEDNCAAIYGNEYYTLESRIAELAEKIPTASDTHLVLAANNVDTDIDVMGRYPKIGAAYDTMYKDVTRVEKIVGPNCESNYGDTCCSVIDRNNSNIYYWKIISLSDIG